MIRNETTYKWLIPVAILFSPLWLGYLPSYSGYLLAIPTIEDFGLNFILLSEQLAIVPYMAYHKNNGYFPHYWLAALSHWAIVLFAYAILSKKRSLVSSLIIFIGLFFGSILVAHALLNICGFRFLLEAP